VTKHPKMSIAEARAVERVATEVERLLLYLRNQDLDATQIRAVGKHVDRIISALVSCVEAQQSVATRSQYRKRR
jgi:hypothetical protein